LRLRPPGSRRASFKPDAACLDAALADGGPLAAGGYACARADSVPQGTRARTRRIVRIIVCIACSIRGKPVQRSPPNLCGIFAPARNARPQGAIVSIMILMPANALSDFTRHPLNLGLEECLQLPKFGRESFKSVDRI